MRNRDNTFTLATAGAPLARARGLAVGLAAAALLVGALLPWTAAGAQTRGGARRVTTIEVDDGRSPAAPLPTRLPFSLFAEEDLAGTGMRMTGTNGWFVPNTGPCPYYFPPAGNGPNAQTCSLLTTSNSNGSQSFFEIGLLAGTPISEFRKIRAIHPGINNMRPPLGYSTPYTAYLAAPFSRRWGPGDGQFGNYFSGVTSTDDGSCRDHTGTLSGNLGAGFPLTAGSDCPVTWAGGRFDGRYTVNQDALLALARENPANFRFDERRFPTAILDTTRFRGDFSTYGLVSDSYREMLQRFGGVTPRGSGPAQERGYPLGLDVRYDAFQFSRPSVRNVVYYQMTVVNNSARVYGRGVDYDSLYMGIHPGMLMGGFNGQSASAYYDFSKNAVILVGGNVTGLCGSQHPPRQIAGISTTCQNTAGFANGAQAFVFLKSPLGDMRNKLFTRPSSQFSTLAVPENIKDDTITYNHAARGGFGATYNGSTARSDRALFGYMASIEELFLDGRSITADLTPAQVWTYFQSEGFRSYTGTITPAQARFNRFVPGSTNQPNTLQHPNPGQRYGNWDYNNDGVQDTIYVPGCGSAGCADVYSDTVASGQNTIFSNVGNVVTMGPFKLAAGDTTEILIAFVAAGDRGSFEAQVNASIENYLNFYAGPAAVPAPTFEPEDIDIVPATVRDTTVGVSNTLIRLRIDRALNRPDPFVQQVYDRIRTSTDPNIVRIRNLNPGLLPAIQSRINRNYSELLVFKSCDRGQTFTVSAGGAADCTPAPSISPTGQPIGLGWRPIARIPVDTITGQPVSSFFTDIVRSGRTYLYSFVTRTRGLIDIPIVDSVGTGTSRRLQGTNLAKALNIDADTISSPLARNGPGAVLVYAPVSLPAGARTATLDTATVSGFATRRVTATAIGSTQSGRYTVFFANRFRVTTIRNTNTGRDSTIVVAERVLTGRSTVGATGTVQTDTVVQSVTFSGPGTIVVSGATVPSNLVSTVNGVQTYVDVVTAPSLGYIIARDAANNSEPFYISTTVSNTTLAFRESQRFPGFTLTFEAPQTTTSTPRFSRVLRAEGDTLEANTVSNNGVVILPAQTTYTGPGGRYAFRYSDDSYGPGAPFRFNSPDSLQAQLNASLAARNDVTTGDTTIATRRLLHGVAGADTTQRPLIPARFPFTVTTANGTSATLAMFRRYRNTTNRAADSVLNNTRLFGNAGDTVRVTVPLLQWVPGDTVYVIERVLRDSTVTIGTNTNVVVTRDSTLPGGRTARVPIQVPRQVVAGAFVLTCTGGSTVPVTTNAPRCNPLVPGTFAATGYLPYRSGWTYVAEFARGFDLFSEIRVNATATTVASVQLTSSDLAAVRVVPNPYIVQSNVDEITGNRVGIGRVLFTNVPTQGVLRVYSVSGQLMNQLSWTAADLTNIGNGTANGDLPFLLRTREGLDMGSGLYLYVLTATGPGANGQVARGKFVIIR